jgi:glycosyltransferase involved in cell wall biosynthesis
MTPVNSKMPTVAIISTCIEEWGGSEELWARSIPLLQAAGLGVIVYKDRINREHPRWAALGRSGVGFRELRTPKWRYFARKAMLRARKRYWNLSNEFRREFRRQLLQDRPALVVIAQGINFDGLNYAQDCITVGFPYVIICQKAVDFYWPQPVERPGMIKAFIHARKCFFVSRHNRDLTEEQFGIRIPNTQLIYNPVDLNGGPVPYPADRGMYRLACIGRLFVLDKGQDILIRLLARPKWRERPVELCFIGSGVDREGLEAMARLYGLTNISFAGQRNDMRECWREFHALALPSRSEGLPLVVLEAMAAGRVAITTTAGGSQEVLEDGVTGFIGDTGTESFDEALERAWQRRDEWEAIGLAAHKDLPNRLPESPAEVEFAKTLITLIHD